MKQAISVLALALFALALPTETHAQFGAVTEKGFGVSPGVSKADESTSYGITAGYVFTSNIEAGLNVARSSAENTDFNTLGIGPYVSIYPVRQSESFPLSVNMGGAYQFNSFSGSAIDQIEAQGGDVSGNSLSFGGGFFHSFAAGKTADVIPFAGVSYTRSKAELSGGGQVQTNTTETTSLDLSVSFVFETSNDLSISATPSVGIADDNTSFGLSASLVVPQE